MKELFQKKDVESGMVSEIYELIVKSIDLGKLKDKTPDEKVLELINNNLLIPISEDFMLYHKDSERYEKIVLDKTAAKKKEDTKIRYIVSKIDNVTEYYSEVIKKKPELKKNIEKNFYTPLQERKAVLINNSEELKIISKLLNQGKRSIENNEFYHDLLNYRVYPYINFKDFSKDGFFY